MESSEKGTDRENYLTAYIQKHETLLLDYLRKSIDLEIKVVAYSSSYNEAIEQLDQVKKELAVQTDLVSQATNGLQSVTVEKNQLAGREEGYNQRIKELENRVKDLEAAVVMKTNETNAAQQELQTFKNNVQNSIHEAEELKRELQRQNLELNNLYSENQELKSKLPAPKKSVKKQETAILPADEF